MQDFKIAPPPRSNLPAASLRIVNSPSNIHDAGKHLACSMATYEHCYFNDDDWLNMSVSSLRAHLTRSGPRPSHQREREC